ncbi:myeloid protein 1-like [Anguilla anguilla]|uniref:myeloid protein 1-like n=1 Tax=Anguilla anguilla TaxID=7936 RepID=UPI0015AD364F|nr:myeloid protein 1-like [Anguilla anguilla]
MAQILSHGTMLLFALSLENEEGEGRAAPVYQTVEETELNPKSKEAGLNPKAKEVGPNPKGKEAGSNPKAIEAGPNPKATEPKVRARGRNGPESRGDQAGRKLRNDATCAGVGGICQRSTYLCQGRYLPDRCAGPRTRQCCVPGPTAWGALCSGHHRNRVRGCDAFGCGTFGSKRGGRIHKAVDVVCEDYSVIRAPFQGTLGGPAQWRGKDGIQYDGVKLSNSGRRSLSVHVSERHSKPFAKPRSPSSKGWR